MSNLPSRGVLLWVRRLGWLLLLWTISVLALGGIAWLLRIVMGLAGLTAG